MHNKTSIFLYFFQVAQQEAQRAVFVVERAKQERQQKILQAEGEAQAAKMISFFYLIIGFFFWNCFSFIDNDIFKSYCHRDSFHRPSKFWVSLINDLGLGTLCGVGIYGTSRKLNVQMWEHFTGNIYLMILGEDVSFYFLCRVPLLCYTILLSIILKLYFSPFSDLFKIGKNCSFRKKIIMSDWNVSRSPSFLHQSDGSMLILDEPVRNRKTKTCYNR